MPLPDNVVAEFTGTSGTEYYIYQIPDDSTFNQALTNAQANYGVFLNSSYLTGTLPTEITSFEFGTLTVHATEQQASYLTHPNNINYDGQNLGSLLFSIVTNSKNNTGDYNFLYDTEYNSIQIYFYLNDGRSIISSLNYSSYPSITDTDDIKFQNNPTVNAETETNFNNYTPKSGMVANRDEERVIYSLIFSSIANSYENIKSLTVKNSDDFKTIDPDDKHYKGISLAVVEKTSSGYTLPSSISYGTYTPPIICFPKNTPVTTDQGIVPIQDLENKPYTIEGNKVLGAVSMTSNEPMVYFKQHSLAYNVPNKNTYITQSHVIYHNNTQLKAIDYTKKDFHKRLCINNLKGIKQEKPIVVKVENNKVYNVVLESGHKMKVNNMLVETLHPSNELYKQKLLK